jgi:hypothetical protein
MKLNHQKVSDKLYSMIPGVINYDFMQYGEHTCRVRFSISSTHKEEFSLYHLNKIGEEFGDKEITIFPGQYEFHMIFMVTSKEYYEEV